VKFDLKGIEVIRSLFYVPMLLSYVCVMFYFISKVAAAARLSKRREHVVRMAFYLGFSAFFALCSIVNFAILASGYYLASAKIWYASTFLFFLGRTGISFCDCR
jgi:hypothetical protein